MKWNIKINDDICYFLATLSIKLVFFIMILCGALLFQAGAFEYIGFSIVGFIFLMEWIDAEEKENENEGK